MDVAHMQWTDPVSASDGPRANGTTDTDAVDALLRAGSPDPDRTLFILSEGFDPRTYSAITRFCEVVGAPQVLAIDPQPPETEQGDDVTQRRRENSAVLEELLGDRLTRLNYPTVHHEASAARQVALHITSDETLRDVTSVVVDISAFPTSLSFPPLRGLLTRTESDTSLQLQVVVTQNADLDHAIEKSNLGDPHILAGFRPKDAQGAVRIWTPVLGPRGTEPLKRIAAYIDPREVCPVLPFPSTNPHRPDDILLAHRELLIDSYEVGPNNLIYAAEGDPFDLYRTLTRFTREYQQTLAPIGSAEVYISVHGSKLLSVGALLAAHELELPIVGIRANRYSLAKSTQDVDSPDLLTCLWLRGLPYDQ